MNSNTSFYSQSYVIDSQYQQIEFGATEASGYTVFASDLIVGSTTLANLDPGVLQTKEFYAGTEYTPSVFTNFDLNSFGLYTCASNGSYKSNTRENDAILTTGNPGQKIHITTANYKNTSLLTLDNDTLYINGNCKIIGTLTKVRPPQNKFKTVLAHSYLIDKDNKDVNFDNTAESGYTAHTSDLFIGNSTGKNLGSNIMIASELYAGTEYEPSATDFDLNDEYYSCDNIVHGILPMKFGGTGTTKRTGSKNVVFSTNPVFDSKITVNNNIYVVSDSVSTPGYSWSNDNTSGMYQSETNKIDFAVNSLNIMNIDINGIFINGNCKSSKFTTTSDSRIQTNMSAITNGVEIISKLEPKIYTKANEIESGLIAQDVYLNAPELVHLLSFSKDAKIEDNDWGSSPAGINYIGLIPYLIQSIKELKETITILESKIN